MTFSRVDYIAGGLLAATALAVAGTRLLVRRPADVTPAGGVGQPPLPGGAPPPPPPPPPPAAVGPTIRCTSECYIYADTSKKNYALYSSPRGTAFTFVGRAGAPDGTPFIHVREVGGAKRDVYILASAIESPPDRQGPV